MEVNICVGGVDAPFALNEIERIEICNFVNIKNEAGCGDVIPWFYALR